MGLLQLLLTVTVMVINQKFFVSGFKSLLHGAPNMLGKPMLGDFTVSCSGHAHNNAFLRQLDQLEGALEAVDC